MAKLKGKVAIITGAGSGIGRATAVLFAKEGAKVAVVDCNKDSGEETVKIIRQSGGEAVFIYADVSKASDVQKMVETVVGKYGAIDILFNNAGINLALPITELPEETWDEIINTNLKGVFLCSKNVIPIMKRQGSGIIINMGSSSALVGVPYFGAYSASKGGILALTRTMALEVAPFKIRVNCICPGMVETPLSKRTWEKMRISEEKRGERAKSIPWGRVGEPEEIARAVLFLASEDSSYMTGSNLTVDGGFTSH
ncbi:MAG: glucose 1-dehydrogenase [Candidatus Bathyarchaeia archaeon]